MIYLVHIFLRYFLASLSVISSLLCFLVLKKLHDKVAAHANSEKNNGEDDLGEDTDSTSLRDEG